MEPGDSRLRLKLRLRRSDKNDLMPKIESSGANQMHDPCRSGLTSNSFSSTQIFFLLFLLLLLLLPSSIFQTLRVVLALFQHHNRPSFNGCLYTSSNLPASFQSFFGFEPLTVSIQLPAIPHPEPHPYPPRTRTLIHHEDCHLPGSRHRCYHCSRYFSGSTRHFTQGYCSRQWYVNCHVLLYQHID